MNNTTVEAKKQEIYKIQNLEQIAKRNQTYDNFHKKIVSDIAKLNAKKTALENKIREIKNKIHDLEHKSYSTDAPTRIWMGEGLELSEKAFEGVTHSAILIDHENYNNTRIYKKNGQWVTISVRYPSKPDGGCDDEHPFIVEEKVEIQ